MSGRSSTGLPEEKAVASTLVDSVEVLSEHPADNMKQTIIGDHPLLERFQLALREHLIKVNDQLNEEIADIDHNVNELNEQIEDIGSNLYDLQQEVERQKDTLDSYNNRIKDVFEKRIQFEDAVRTLQKELRTSQEMFKENERMYNDRLTELDKLQMLQLSIEKWHQEMRSELEVSKRIIGKDKQEKQRKSNEKMQMDLLLLNLEAEVRRCEAASSYLSEQIHAQEMSLDDLNAKLADANADLEALQGEHKQLIGSWKTVIHFIRARDEMLAKTRETLM